VKVDAKFVRNVQHACERALLGHGFEQPRRGEIVIGITPEFLGWVGLNVGKHSDFVRINPFVGVHCVPVMKLVAEATGEKYQTGRYATYAVHLGEVAPNEEQFVFSSERQIEIEAERLAVSCRESGVPYMRSISTFESLLPLLEEKVPMFGGYPQRVAAAMYLMGRKKEALNFVERLRLEYRDDPVIRDSFERFAGPFEKLVA